ncbi:major capsid protein [Bradyrhizobium cenepequi]
MTMATIGNSYPSLIDAYKGSAEGTVIEILNKQNPVLDDAIATQCNMDAVHRHMIRTGLPSVAWGRLYQGVPQSKTTMQQVDDTTGFLEALSGVDTRLLALAPDPAKQRLVRQRAIPGSDEPGDGDGHFLPRYRDHAREVQGPRGALLVLQL